MIHSVRVCPFSFVFFVFSLSCLGGGCYISCTRWFGFSFAVICCHAIGLLTKEAGG